MQVRAGAKCWNSIEFFDVPYVQYERQLKKIELNFDPKPADQLRGYCLYPGHLTSRNACMKSLGNLAVGSSVSLKYLRTCGNCFQKFIVSYHHSPSAYAALPPL